MKSITRTVKKYTYQFALLGEAEGDMAKLEDIKEFESYTPLTSAQQRRLKAEHVIDGYTLLNVSVEETLYGCTLDEFMSVAKVINKEEN